MRRLLEEILVAMMRERALTERDADVLWCLPLKEWVTPFAVGGTDASHHSATLRKLERRGMVERKRRSGWVRRSFLYRLTSKGDAAYRAYRIEHPIEEP
jgi:chromosome segregation and condensation protein ScpB